MKLHRPDFVKLLKMKIFKQILKYSKYLHIHLIEINLSLTFYYTCIRIFYISMLSINKGSFTIFFPTKWLISFYCLIVLARIFSKVLNDIMRTNIFAFFLMSGRKH